MAELIPSQRRSALVQALLQQTQRNQGRPSYSLAGSMDIAAAPLLAALLGRREDKAQQEQKRIGDARMQALSGQLSRSGIPGPQGEAARRAALITSGGMQDNPLAQAILGAQAQRVFAAPEKNYESTSDLRTIANPSVRSRLGITEDQQVEVREEKLNGRVSRRYIVGPQGEIDLTDTDVGAPIERTQAVSPSDVSKLNESQIATSSLISNIGDALSNLQENEDVNTLVARSAGIVNSIKQEASALGRELGVNIPASILDPGTYSGTFDKLGIQNAQMRSLITSIAWKMAQAQGQTGQAASNRDVERFIQEVGGSSSDADTLAAVLTDVAVRADRDFRTRHQVVNKTPFEGTLGLESLPMYKPPAASQTPGDERTIKFEDGTTITFK